MMRKRHRFLRLPDQRGSVTVEIALVLTFFLLPLLVGTVDFAYIMATRVQLNSALQAAEMFAWANPDSASDSTAINTLLNGNPAVVQITQSTPPTMSYTCLQQDGSTTAATLQWNTGYSSSSLATTQASQGLSTQAVPASSESIGNGMGTASCGSGSVQANVTYALSATIDLPISLPVLGGQSVQTVTGTIWVR